MGSTNTRKKNDRVRINTPEPKSGSGGSAGGQRDVNAVCPMAFDVLLQTKMTIPEGTPISVDESKLLIFGKEVGQIPSRHLKTLVECGRQGITYSTRAVNGSGGKNYARFEQRA